MRWHLLSLTSGGPVSLLLELALQQVSTLSDEESLGFLDIAVQHGFALNAFIEFALEYHFGGFFHQRSHLVSSHGSCWWRCQDWNSELSFIVDRGSDVFTMLILLGTNVLGDTLESINEGVSLLVVTVIKDIA